MFKDVFWKEPDSSAPKTSKHDITEEKEPVVEEEYDPFKHRNVKKPTSDFEALTHILKTSFGSGILAMPMAFRHAGLIVGAVGTIFLGALSTHCVQMLVWNSQVLCRRHRVPTLTFSETAERAFIGGPKMFRKCSKFVGTLVTIELLGSFVLGNAVYVVFISHTINQMVEFYWKPEVDVRIFAALLWIPLMLMCMLPNLKSLVPFSIIANILVLTSFSIILYYIFRHIRPFPSVSLAASIETWPLFMGTIIFAIEGIGTVLTIENEMRNPDHFIGGSCGILYIGMVVVVALYGFIGFFGYLQYGDETKGSISLNLPVQEPLAQAVKALIALAIFFTYALQFYVPINLIVRMIISKLNDKYHFYTKLGVRIGLVSITIIISIVIPHLEPIISLVGAICFSMLGLLFPAMIDIMTNYPMFGFWKWRLWKNIIIQMIAVLILVTGAHSSIIDIMGNYAKDWEEDYTVSP